MADKLLFALLGMARQIQTDLDSGYIETPKRGIANLIQTLQAAVDGIATGGIPVSVIRSHTLTDTEYKHATRATIEDTVRKLHAGTRFTHVDVYSPDEDLLYRVSLLPKRG